MKYSLLPIVTALVTGAAMLMSQPLQGQTVTTHFNASVSSPSQSAGLYKFATESYAPEQIKRNIYASGGAVANDNYYYTVRYEVVAGLPVIERTSYSLKTYGVEDSYPNGSIKNVATDIAYFAPRDEAYGCFFNENGDGYVFGKYQFGYFTCTKICDLTTAFAALDFDSNGTLYAIDWEGKLFTVDTTTGAQTLVGDTGLTTDMITGGAIERTSNTFYYSVHATGASAIYTVDLETAQATKAYDLENDEQVGGLYFPNEYNNGAPAASGNPSINFSTGSLSGTVRFRAPQKTVGGEILSGDVTYHILANGVEVASGNANYDEGYKNADVTLSKADKYCISLVFSNEAGTGPRSKASQWIGPDTPKAPTNPRLTYNNGTVKLFWTAVGSTGVNGGSISTSGLTYTVTRYPDGAVTPGVTSGWTDTVEMPDTRTTYYYEIKAVTADGTEGEAVKSPEFSLGPIVPPYNETFATMYNAIGWKWLNNDSYVEDNYSQSNGMRLVTMNLADDGAFLVSPQISMKAKASYEISFQARCGNSSYNETFELVAGKSDDAQGLSETTILGATTLESTTLAPFTATFTPEESGNYYIAFKGTESGRMLYVKEFNIAKGVSKGTPAEVTDLTVTPDAAGAHKASISFTLPTQDSEGETLAEITKVELLRDGEVIATETEGLTPGASISMEDSDVPVGDHIYSVVCYNENGNGTSVASEETWVGFTEPVPVEWVKVKELETLGTVTITWAPAVKDYFDRPIKEEDVTYNLYNRDGELVRNNLTERSVTLYVCEPVAAQEWTQFRVSAVNEGGESDKTKSLLTPVGKPDKAPWHESWPGKETSHLIGTTKNSVDDQWQVVAGFSYNDRNVNPQDNDGGMMGLENLLMEEPVALFTGKIDLSTIAEPTLSFWVYNYIGDNGKDNENEINVMVFGTNDDEFKSVKIIKIGETGPKNQWNRVLVPLTAYASDAVRIRLETTVVTSIYVHLDNISVDTHSEYNVAARNISAPASVEAGNDFNISFDVVNTGSADVKNIDVALHHNGESIATQKVSLLAAGATKTVSFSHKLSTLHPDSNTYHCVLTAEGDLVSDDNISGTTKVLLRRSGMPLPTNTTASIVDNNVVVEWTAPDLTLLPPASVVESFESAQSWKSEVDGWTFKDYDAATIGGIGTKQLPVSGQQSFFVADDTHAELNYANDGTRFKAHTGHHSLWSMYSMRGNYYIQSDDWAISPELYGGAQMISLWASSFEADANQTQYLESFEVLVSETGLEKDDFVLVSSVSNVPAQWTKYEFYLPQGSKYVAVRGTSYDKYILMIDDIELKYAQSVAESREIAGYDIWRNGEKLNDTPLTESSYTDSNVEHGNSYEYRVAAVYEDNLVSAPTEAVSIHFLSGINSAEALNPAIRSGKGEIIISAAGCTVTVYSIDGSAIYTGECKGQLSVEAAPGAYIVKAGSATAKVLVR